jgi:DNA mismatch repair protein MutS
MSHIGSFVPAEKAEIGIVDRVFTRIGASDNLSEGESTFMVEMNEVANIIKNATDKSLVILDEVGRGTSTYDGLSLAWAITEYIHTQICCRCLFATHYHELIDLENNHKGIKNYNIAVKEKGDNIIFLRQILPGGTDKSYGLHVAKLAGLPTQIVNNAKNMMDNMDQGSRNNINHNKNMEETKYNIIFNHNNLKIIDELKKLDLLNTSPIEAINILYDYQKKIKEEI